MSSVLEKENKTKKNKYLTLEDLKKDYDKL